MAEKAKKKDKKTLLKTTCDETSKKPAMKTANDVISRLLWDESLPEDKFNVGYLDRFDGIVEKSFVSLDWRDPAIVDNHTLALPKHRIQYFKYLTRKVWDKRNRTDIIFGSTGYALSIHEFMAKVDNNIVDFHDEYIVPENMPSQDRRNSESSEEIVSEDESDLAGRPNFFIAARIANKNSIEKLTEVSDYIKSKDELMGECCIQPELLHLTFSILKLDSSEDVSNAVSALQSLAQKNLPPVTLHLEALDNFKHRVLYSSIRENKDLMKVRKALIDELVMRKVVITDRFSFVPHVTIAKLSRSACRLRHSKYIDQYLYLKFEDNEFGSEKISNLYLCEMGASRREDGFYKCACEVSLNL